MIFEIASWVDRTPASEEFPLCRKKPEPQRTLSFTEEQTKSGFYLATSALLKDDAQLSRAQAVRARGRPSRYEWTMHAGRRSARAWDYPQVRSRFRPP